MLFHCVFSTYRRHNVFEGELEDTLRRIIEGIIADKGLDVPMFQIMPDHVHLLLRAQPIDVARAMNLVKGIAARRFLQAFPDLRMDMHSHHLWASGYYARTIEEAHKAAVIEYVRNQEG